MSPDGDYHSRKTGECLGNDGKDAIKYILQIPKTVIVYLKMQKYLNGPMVKMSQQQISII